MRPDAPRHGERGVALLTVLLLVAVIAVIASGALERLRLATRLTGNAVSLEGARAATRTAEAMALLRIDDLLGRDPSRVTLEGDWSGRAIPLPLPGGAAVARVTDGGNCFNLNGLVTPTQTGLYVDYPPAKLAFARLIRLVGGVGQESEGVAAAAADWIDSDQDQQPGGAEDQVYLGLPQPYRTAGTLMADPSELRAVSGVTPELYMRLRPYLCTLPVAAPARLNINTIAPEQAPLIVAEMAEGASVAAVQQALLRRPPTGFASAAAFWTSLPGAQVGDAAGHTGITSTWFALKVEVAQGDARLDQRALIDATRLPARVVARQWGEE